MSTRTTLVFSSNNDDKLDYGIPIYKHCDGYPSYILHLLRQYLWVNKYRLDDISYLSAGFLRYCERYRNQQHIPEEYSNRDEDDYFLNDPYTGLGLFETDIPEHIINGQEDYYYKITPEKVIVFSNDVTKIYEITMDELLETPDEEEYFEQLERKIFNGDV